MVLADTKAARIPVVVIRVVQKTVVAGDPVAVTAIVRQVDHALGRRTLPDSVDALPVIVRPPGPKMAPALRSTVLHLIVLRLTGHLRVVLRLATAQIVETARPSPIAAHVLPMRNALDQLSVRLKVAMVIDRSLRIAALAPPSVIDRPKPIVPAANGLPMVTTVLDLHSPIGVIVTALLPLRRSRLVSPHGVLIVVPVRTVKFV
jgi:hypothetical protein